MSHLSEQILQTVEELPAEDQQQVLDWARSMLTKRKRVEITEPTSKSFFEVAQTAIGAGEGPGDLSVNQDYMQDYGL